MDNKHNPQSSVEEIPLGDLKIAEDSFDLNVALKALATDNPALLSKIESDEQKLRHLREQVVDKSRSNFILERELAEIDEKIKLLIKNRISVQEVTINDGSKLEKDESDGASLKGKRAQYEQLFYLLQTKPRYLATLARVINAKEVQSFVQTVVFDMYGDQYDTREERLLLSIFRFVLKAELDEAQDQGSLLRANTAITQMLSAYARRGQGLAILKEILEAPLKDITSKSNLNLEINPQKVYQQLIADHETNTGQKCPWPRDASDEDAAKQPEVQVVIEERVKHLLHYVQLILSRIMNAVESVPYGMRWICKQLGTLAKQRFPDSDKYQIGSLMGGYIYLRFFNPVIVTPDAINFIQTKPSTIMRRNLVLIAKVLQNLSNGLLFRDKEYYMRVMNPFIESNREPLQEYFQKLAAVDDLEDALQVDKYLQHTSKATVLTLSINQVFVTHSIVQQHLNKLALDSDDPIIPIAKALGAAPAQVSMGQNRSVTLQLSDTRSQRLSTTTDAFAAPSMHPLYLQAKKTLLSVLRRLPSHSENQHSLQDFLEEELGSCSTRGDTQLADAVLNAVNMLRTLHAMGLLGQQEPSKAYDAFMWDLAKDSLGRRERSKQLDKRIAMVESALRSITGHHQYLVDCVHKYKEYLENVHKGQHMQATKATKSSVHKVLKFTHAQLEEWGVVAKVVTEFKPILKKCTYTFSQAAPGRFRVEVHMKKMISIPLTKQPFDLDLGELLRKQEHAEAYLDIEQITLNVNFLIHLLNTHFLKDK